MIVDSFLVLRSTQTYSVVGKRSFECQHETKCRDQCCQWVRMIEDSVFVNFMYTRKHVVEGDIYSCRKDGRSQRLERG